MPIPAISSRGASTLRTHATRPVASSGVPSGRASSSSTRRPGASGSGVRTNTPPRETLTHHSREALKNTRPVYGSVSGSMVEMRTGTSTDTR